MVLKANIAYGFRRNLWAIRTWGTIGTIFALLATVAHLYIHGSTSMGITTALLAVSGLIGFWRLSADWVREPAFLYAHRLLEAAEAS
jgi:hypothetical protein